MLSTVNLEIRIEAPPGQSWPGLALLTQTWNAELEKQGFGRFQHASRKTMPNCPREADLLHFVLAGDYEKLIELVRERLRAFQVPPSTVVSFLELTRDGQPAGEGCRFVVLPAADEPSLVPWGWQEQAMMAVILTELAKEPRWRDLARRLEEPLSRFLLMGMGAVEPAALAPEERAAFLAAAEGAYQAKANEGPVGWERRELFPDWLRRFRLHLDRWRQASA